MSKERGTPIDPELDPDQLDKYDQLIQSHKETVAVIRKKVSLRAQLKIETSEDAELEVQVLFARIAACFGEEAACGLFKKYSKRTRSKPQRDTALLLRFYLMEKPQKLTLAKQIDPKNPQRILAQLKRALTDSRYARLRKGLALVGRRSADIEGTHDKWRSFFDLRFPGRR
jgi:hypothetical protein